MAGTREREEAPQRPEEEVDQPRGDESRGGGYYMFSSQVDTPADDLSFTRPGLHTPTQGILASG